MIRPSIPLVMPFFVAVVMVAAALPAKTIRVPLDEPTIQAGINAAVSGDIVEVACGTYHEHDIAMRSGVTLKSESGDPACVVIDAQQQGQVLSFRSVPSATRVEGVTITGGHIEPVFGEGGSGGGMSCIDLARPTLVDCIITGNFAGMDGGGVFVGYSSFPTFINCQIVDNEAGNGGAGVRALENATPVFQNCSISNNIGTGVWSSNNSNPQFTGCTISGNENEGVLTTMGAATLENCTISGNLAGGVRSRRGTVSLTGCAITGNFRNAGAGVYLMDAEASLTDCMVSGNTALGTGGAFYLEVWINPTARLTAETTEFRDNVAPAGGVIGFLEAGTQAALKCSVDDSTGIEGTGSLSLDNEDCPTPVQGTSWTGVKQVFR